MALVVKDRVKETTATTGTGTLTLAGADTGFQAFSSALSDGDTTYYSLVELSTGEWEVGLGTFTATGTTLARTTILASSNSGSAINLTAGEASVFITQPAGKAAFFDSSGDLILNQDPTTALMAATKEYVDTIAAAGIHYHDPVRVESPDTAGNLTATYDNGSSGVGATLTNAGTQAALVIDGVTVNTNDRVLIYSQTNGYENGVYTVTNTGSASTNWVLTRATDADSYGPSDPDSLGQGDAFFVKEGDTGAGELYVMNTAGEIIFGTTNIMFTVVAETAVYSAGDGLSLTGTTFAVGQGTGVTVSSSTVSIGQAVGTSDSPTFSSLSVTNAIDAASLSIENVAPSIYLLESDTTDLNTRLRTNGGQLNIQTSNDANTSNVSRFSIDHLTGDISFYEDTGTTAKFFWDASAESLGIGTTSPLNPLHINVGTDQNLRVFSASSTPTIGSLNDANSAYAALGYTGSQHEFRLGTTEAMRIDSSGNVGIGTSSPNSPLEVSNGTENHRVAFGTGEVYLMARNASSYITQEYIANQHVFTGYGDNSSNEAMRIDSSGNLLVGTTSTATNDVGFKVFQSTGQTVTTASGTNPVLFNRKTSDGDIAIFRKDDVTVGSIGSNSSGGQPLLDINAQTTGSSQMRFTTSGSERMRILSGGGVRIAQTSADWGYLSVQQDFDAKSDTGVASGGYAYIQLPDYAHAGLIIVKVINDGNSNANLSRLYLYNSRPTAFGGGNDVSQIGGTHGSTGTSQEPYANSPVITNNSSGTNARLRLTVGLNSGTGSVSVYARCINI